MKDGLYSSLVVPRDIFTQYLIILVTLFSLSWLVKIVKGGRQHQSLPKAATEGPGAALPALVASGSFAGEVEPHPSTVGGLADRRPLLEKHNASITTPLAAIHSTAMLPHPPASQQHASFKSFRRAFLVSYLLLTTADWLQGAYVYRLYSYYGFTRTENGLLFITGYGSSLIFGTWAGPIADRHGRKFTVLLYGLFYTLSCVTKFFNNFEVLMVGRMLSGIATSILCSAFESWMVAEHNARGFDQSWVGETFSYMNTLNGLAAIVSGFMAQLAVKHADGHPVAPFGLAAGFLVVGSAIVALTWRENHGDKATTSGRQLKEAFHIIFSNKNVAFIGLQQALFEGTMYIFVFMWSPALELGYSNGEESKMISQSATTTVLSSHHHHLIPYGIIFACFMMASSLGSTIFGFIDSHIRGHKNHYPADATLPAVGDEAVDNSNNVIKADDHLGRFVSVSNIWYRLATPPGVLQIVFLVSTMSLLVPVLSSSRTWLMFAFVTFELCVGMYWPLLGVLRTQFLPEGHRATIINIFRIPLNIMVCGVLAFQGSLSVSAVFSLSTCFLASAFIVAAVMSHGYHNGHRMQHGRRKQ